MLKTITVRELMACLEGEDPDMPVIFTADYGDYHHTPQALRIRGELEEVQVAESGYSHSGYALVEAEDRDEDSEGVAEPTYLVLR